MISVRIGPSTDFWVTGSSQIRSILAAMKIYIEEVESLGYRTTRAFAGGGVHELDTGYESFSQEYDSFEEMEEKLCTDFDAAEAELDGLWFNTLNFDGIYVSFENEKTTGSLRYCRGVLVLDCPSIENETDERCSEKIAPLLYHSPENDFMTGSLPQLAEPT